MCMYVCMYVCMYASFSGVVQLTGVNLSVYINVVGMGVHHRPQAVVL